MPRLLLHIVLCIIQSMASRNNMGVTAHTAPDSEPIRVSYLGTHRLSLRTDSIRCLCGCWPFPSVSVKMWSTRPTLGLKRCCSFLRWRRWHHSVRLFEWFYRRSYLLPRGLLHPVSLCIVSYPFLGILTILHQSTGMVLAFQSVATRMPVLSTSVAMLYYPGALLLFRFLIAFTISFCVGGEQSISSLSPRLYEPAQLDLVC